MPKISLVVPAHNESETVNLFYEATQKVKNNSLEGVELEYWFIDDGSTDDTIHKLEKLHQLDPDNVHYIEFSRNFGKESAMYAGLENASGDYVAVMDADLQDPPELLPTMLYDIQHEDYDAIGTRRVNRDGEPPIRSFFANMFYKLINKISTTEIVNGARDYRLMKRQMVDAIVGMPERNRFSKGIFSWVGFKTKYLPYENIERVAGTTSWSFRGLLSYSIDGIVDFSNAALSIATFFGFFSFLIAMIALIVIIAREVFYGNPTPGWPSLACIMLMIGGIQLLCLGIVGKYIGKIYIETKRRPIYITRTKK